MPSSPPVLFPGPSSRHHWHGLPGNGCHQHVLGHHSTDLGFLGTFEVKTFEGGNNLLRCYHCTTYLAGLASSALGFIGVFIRKPKHTREDWGEDETGQKGETNERPLGA